MIIFLHGKDTYRMKEKLSEIVEGYKKANKNCLDLSFFDISKKTEDIFKDFKDRFRQTSMFKEKKLVVVANPFLSPVFKERFSEEIDAFSGSDDILVLLQEGETSKNSVLLKLLLKKAKCQEFDILTGQNLKSWAEKRFFKYGGKTDFGAVDFLVGRVGSDLWRMDNEIRKLSNYGKGRVIGKEDVRLMVRPYIETDIFKTIDAVAQRKKDIALGLLQKHSESGDSPLYLISMINYQFRNLLVVKDFVERCKPYDVIIKKSGLHPFVVKKSYSQCREFSFEELKKIYQKIFRIDFEIKTGKVNPEAGLELLIAEI